MIKNYTYILSFLFCMLSATVFAQDAKSNNTTIEGLNFYPNPVSNGRIYVTSKLGLDKEIAIFDVLGKKVLQTVLTTKELVIGSLQPGVYIIKFKENEATATRKLIVK